MKKKEEIKFLDHQKSSIFLFIRSSALLRFPLPRQ